MLFKKPKDLKYTDMAIWLDQNMYKEDVDVNKMYEYIWHLVYMLARKGKFFHKAQYYEDFSTWTTSSIYFRIKNKKQFEDPPRLDKIKSILNYLKKVLYKKKVDFEQEFYSQVITNNTYDIEDEVLYDTNYYFSDKLSESVDELTKVEFECCLHDSINTIKNFLKKIPYYRDRPLWDNIYISCLLTFLNSIILSKKEYDKIASFKYKDFLDSKLDQIKDNLEDEVILYHLPQTMGPYIKVLIREVQHVVAKDLSSYLHAYIPSGSNMKYMVLSEMFNNDTSWEDRDEN